MESREILKIYNETRNQEEFMRAIFARFNIDNTESRTALWWDLINDGPAKIKIGEFQLTDGGYGNKEDQIEIAWLKDGKVSEAMDCDKVALEPIIAKFYKEKF